MNRRYTKEDYIKLVEKLRGVRPGIVISTDFIVGFPGETEEDFEHTMDVIERIRFDSAFTFLYSPRKGTPAAEFEDSTPADVKQKRFDRMVKRLNEITLEINLTYVGTVHDVLVEGPSKTDPSMISGRTFGNKLVNFSASVASSESGASSAPGARIAPPAMTGAIVPVRITSVKTFSFTGELINNG
jgi:tRNA-2-methylthio-N6-dimethylallyladenosine synthase